MPNLAFLVVVLASAVTGELSRAHLASCQVPKAQTYIQAVSGSVFTSTVMVGKSQFIEYATPTVNSYGRSVVENDRIWIPSQGDEIVGLSESGNYVSYSLPRGQCGLYTMRTAIDGFWYVRVSGRTVGHLALNGDLTERPLDRGPVDVGIDGTPYFDGLIEYGPDGTRWATSHLGVERYTPGSTAKRFPFTGVRISSLLPDSTGAWLAEFDDDKVTHITNDGKIDVAAATVRGCLPRTLVASAGAVWFSCFGFRKIGRISADGSITMVNLPDPGSIAAVRIFGAPRGLWIVDFHRVFRLNITESSHGRPERDHADQSPRV